MVESVTCTLWSVKYSTKMWFVSYERRGSWLVTYIQQSHKNNSRDGNTLFTKHNTSSTPYCMGVCPLKSTAGVSNSGSSTGASSVGTIGSSSSSIRCSDMPGKISMAPLQNEGASQYEIEQTNDGNLAAPSLIMKAHSCTISTLFQNITCKQHVQTAL
jgi:hypothetical protein